MSFGSFGAGPTVPGSRKEMCIRCSKPETTSAFVVYGDIDWLAAALHRFAGLPMDEAGGTAEVIYNDHDATPNQRNQTLVRLCQDCAKLTDVPVYNLDTIKSGQEVRGVLQPDNL